MRAQIDQYNQEALQFCTNSKKADWDVATDVGNKQNQKHLVNSMFSILKQFDIDFRINMSLGGGFD